MRDRMGFVAGVDSVVRRRRSGWRRASSETRCALFGGLFGGGRPKAAEGVGTASAGAMEGDGERGVLVVGARGRVGQRVVSELVRRQERVFGLVKSRGGGQEASEGDDGLESEIQRTGGRLLVGVLGEESAREAVQEVSGKVRGVIWAAGPSQTSPSKVVDNEALKETLGCLKLFLRGIEDRMIVDLSDRREMALFKRLDDVIMGGVSQSSLSHKEGAPGEKSFAVFEGTVRLEQNGGFCGVRRDFQRPIDLLGAHGIVIRVRGDGQRYKINLKNDEEPEFVFQTEIETTAQAAIDFQWEVIRVPFAKFVPVKRGNIQYGEGSQMYAKALDPRNITSVGLLRSKLDVGAVSSSFVPGPFRLEVRDIAAYWSQTPTFVVLSSAAVTRPTWNAERRKKYASSYDIPIVQMNPGGILTEKLLGEDAVRASGIPYTIVRYTALNDDHPNGDYILSQDDLATGRINRDDAARLAVDAFYSENTTYKTFEASTAKSTPSPLSPARPSTEEIFAALRYDRIPQLSPQSVESRSATS